ncbi:MAG: hypothetical protein H6612_01735 [Ignavibacteriales bacterium]|nr:hypothetical protein [Ignavibacteriales bacterium]MCB9209403.1 hypothetical protein [Ignavibacteriales bacterium]MCB9258046.1 hypothetical protein [Ignavibacteriales bacterium]
MNNFNEEIYREVSFNGSSIKGNVINSDDVEIVGTSKITVEEESHEGVRIILNKDANDNIKEIKFVCSCGETKSVLLDYSEE